MGILDTCTLLWLVADQGHLSPPARAFLAAHAGRLFVSAISAFEIALKQRKGALGLPLPTRTWYSRALEFHGLREVPLDGPIAIAAAELPPLHRDPCDRIIVATAQAHGLTILTPDPAIAAYPGASVVW
ncbi:MAG: type II toxin-antitoxin system VapC family toxin [Deltaproteobacteria bacterium]|nr:type II toxin-antitoxin system VapC family toxin [Deltaproteobacteria bacterium]